MHTLSILGVVSLLTAFALAAQASPPSDAKLVRRHDDHVSFTNIYIMRQGLDYSHGPLQIHNPDGSVAFLFDKVTHDRKKGVSTTVVKKFNNPFSYPLLQLDSEGDLCGHKSTYIEPDVTGANHRRFKIDPRGPKADRWTFSFVAPSGEEFSYKFKRNYLDKGGEIYRRMKGQDDVLVAELADQVRWEPWLNPRSTGTSTFTLSSTADAPLVELVALMGLVMTRVHECRL